MRNFRGLTKDGKMVYGWLAEIEGKYFIIDIKAEFRPLTAYGKYGKPGEGWKEFFGTYGIAGFIEVIPESIAQQVGLKDKNEDEIYEGDKIAFNVDKQFGTNKRYEGRVYFCKTRLSYCVKCLPAWDMPIYHNLRDIEIIPPELLEKQK